MNILKLSILSLITAITITSCGGGKSSIQVHGITSKVVKVVSGNQIELQNGLKVEILGIAPSGHTKKYLNEHVKGETVVIIRDHGQKEHISGYKTKVKAYAKIKGERHCVSGKMLLSKTAKLRQTSVKDSLQSFIKYSKDTDRREMTSTELNTYMKPASFLIVCADGSSGTGFFINDDGLALTNNHVWDGSQSAIVCYMGENGKYDKSNTRQINSMVDTQMTGKIDYTIFYVNLRPGEKSQYMPIASQHAKDGEMVYKIGCPLGQVGNFQSGDLSNYNDDGSFTHSIGTNPGDSGGPIVNARGEVLGINQSVRVNQMLNELANNIAYGVDIQIIKKYLDNKSIEYGK